MASKSSSRVARQGSNGRPLRNLVIAAGPVTTLATAAADLGAKRFRFAKLIATGEDMNNVAGDRPLHTVGA